MQNTKILEMLNNGKIEELKSLIKEEIFMDGIKSRTGKKQRYVAMKKYFSYVYSDNPACTMPCIINFNGEKYTSFVNGYSIALTKETSGEMELFEDPDKYLNVQKMIKFDGEEKEIDLNAIIAEAKSNGYKLKNSEVRTNEDYRYIFHYDDAYFKIGLLDVTYSIINDGRKSTVWHPGVYKKHSPIVIKNSIGICMILPFHYDDYIKKDVTIIEVT